MKHLPNLLTLGNLFCGCIAIVYVLTAQPYTSMSLADGSGLPSWRWVYGAEQIYMGSIFIAIAAFCDLLDGFTARALRVFSPIGKDLDSLADVVSFGVAPSVILFKLLWDSLMQEQNAFDVNMLGMAPAFLLACFAALRLAKFNITNDQQKTYFIGMPTPAAGLFVASFPLVLWYNPYNLITLFVHDGFAPTWVVNLCQFTANTQHLLTGWLANKWVLYLIIGFLCWLMVSKAKFIKLMPTKWRLAYVWPQLILVIAALALIPFLQVIAFPVLFVLYVILSLTFKQPEPAGIETGHETSH
jgi:CDP-diacylglycerol--serine O-phosphatidyltransferase